MQNPAPSTLLPLATGQVQSWRTVIGAKRRFAVWTLNRIGWRLIVAPFPTATGVLIVYPHTSNWDFVIGVLAKWSLPLPLSFMAKESLFKGITGLFVGNFLRYVGAIPVIRDRATGATAQMATHLRDAKAMWLAITPEGTRSRREQWRSGFYHIALEAGVPIALGYFDFPRKEIAMTRFFYPSGVYEKDVATIRAYFEGHHGYRAAYESPICWDNDARDRAAR